MPCAPASAPRPRRSRRPPAPRRVPVLPPRERLDADADRRTGECSARGHRCLHRKTCVDETRGSVRPGARTRRHPSRGRHPWDRPADRRRARLAAARRRKALQQPRPSPPVRCPDRQRAPVPGLARKKAPDEHAKTYTAEQLATLSKLPPEVVAQLAIFGLIEARHGLYGFRDLAAARQVAGLLAAGTKLSAITRSLNEIRKWLPDAGLANLKLAPESSDRLLVEQMQGRMDGSGQFVLDVATPADDADALFERAQLAEEHDDLAEAERLYRRVMHMDPGDPAAPFNLGNVLRAAERPLEAETAYRAAVKADPAYA